MANRERTKKKRERPFLNRERTPKRPFRFLERTARTPKRPFRFLVRTARTPKRPFQSLVRTARTPQRPSAISVAGAAGEFGGSENRGKSVVTRMSCRGRPAALLSPRGSSSGLFFLGPGRAPGGYSHTPNNTHNRRPSPPRAPLPRSARSGDRREDARRGRRPSKRKTRRGPPRRAMSVLK